MSNEARKEYLERIRGRYRNASRRGKKVILDEFCAVCGYHRKYAIRVLNSTPQVGSKKPGRPKQYGEDLIPHVRQLWRMTGYVGAVRLQAAMRLWLKYYRDTEPGLKLTPKEFYQLKRISPSTVARVLKRIRGSMKGLSSTRVDYLLKSQIPIGILDYKVSKPGCMQADTVAHCGNAIFGEYAHTLTMTDVFSFWTENRAIWTKDSKQVHEQMESVESELPFDLHTLSTDCGTEFLNYRVLNHLRNRRKPVHFMRSRPYQKDDNAYVEQKNWTHVRQLFGYDRIEDQSLIWLMNKIYSRCWNPLQNFFIPSMKIKEKKRVGGKIRKIYDEPKTPCERLLESRDISENQKKKLRAQLKELNPFTLRAELENKLREFFKLLKASQNRLQEDQPHSEPKIA